MKTIKMKTIASLAVVLSLVTFSSCNENYPDSISKVTYYPDIVLDGANPYIHQMGDAYTDPGAEATENGSVIEHTTSISSGKWRGATLDANASTMDHFTVTYTAINQDGLPGTASRDVWVANNGDLVNSIEGIYTSTIVRNGVPKFAGLQYIIIWKNDDGTYEVSDGFGGYYSVGVYPQFGTLLRSSGMKITANDIANNDFTVDDFGNDYFGGTATVDAITVDPVAKTINFKADWDAGFVFDVTLTQVDF